MVDVFLTFKLKERKIILSALIEHTKRPEPYDLERLGKHTISRIRAKYNVADIVIKVLHHCGIGSGKTLFFKMAEKANVELLECRSKTIDLVGLLRKRRFI